MFLVVGLGNPGSEYKGTRHNVGFMAVDELVRRHNFTSWRKRFRGETSEGTINGKKIIVLKPQTYMNRSGESVQEAMSFYKIPIENVIVFHDDLDVPVGRLKGKVGGGAAGHNGLRSIDEHCTSGYTRIRIGIDRPVREEMVIRWVLTTFSKEDTEILTTQLEQIAEAFHFLLEGGVPEFTSRLALLQSKNRKG